MTATVADEPAWVITHQKLVARCSGPCAPEPPHSQRGAHVKILFMPVMARVLIISLTLVRFVQLWDVVNDRDELALRYDSRNQNLEP